MGPDLPSSRGNIRSATPTKPTKPVFHAPTIGRQGLADMIGRSLVRSCYGFRSRSRVGRLPSHASRSSAAYDEQEPMSNETSLAARWRHTVLLRNLLAQRVRYVKITHDGAITAH
jgi:hypothetical protein